ncbi:MAG: hypothetical protein ACTHME_03590 [Candidatus Nitrosocosmicus sp.]
MVYLNNAQLTYIGKKLDRNITKKKYPNRERDYSKAAVMFYDLTNMGYIITRDEVRKATELVNSEFSEEMIEEIGHIAEGMYYLKLGLDDEFRNYYGITIKELEENI